MKNQEITIIKLLNNISKDEIVPKQIKYLGIVYTFDTEDKTYYDKNGETFFKIYNFRILKETVEILPEANDEWEDIESYDIKVNNGIVEINTDEHNNVKCTHTETVFVETINQLIKNQKYLKEKLEDNTCIKTKTELCNLIDERIEEKLESKDETK